MRLRIMALASMTVAVTASSRAAAQASLYVPIDDIAYKYADALMARGELRGVSLLERPYTAQQLAAGADTALSHAHSAVVKSYALALRTALQRYTTSASGATTSDEASFTANADVFATAQTSAQRELMLADTSRSVTGGVGFRLAMVAGPVAVMIHPIIDNRLNNDPAFAGKQDRVLAGRTEDAYASAQWKYGSVFLGRIVRNWGPSTLQGLQLGSAPYSYDHLYTQLGTDRIHISSLATRLDDAFQPDAVYARYFYTHRLSLRWRDLEVGASEGMLSYGVGRSYDPTLLNPLNIYALSWRNEHVAGNLTLGGTAALRTGRFGNFSSELLIGNRQIDSCPGLTCQEPASYGFSATAEGVPLFGDQKLFASYSRLSGLAYRAKEGPAGQYASLGVGLGQAFSDYDEFKAGVDLAAIPYATLRLYGAYRRQGQGDYHLPFPTPEQYPTTPGIFEGVVEKIARAGIEGGGMIAPGFELTGDVGVNHATNWRNLAGVTHNGVAARVRFQFTPRGLFF